ncbi:MAG: hypothetical protein RR936_04050 [Carnobacterium sp.]|uniref:hypothetical protein n=1 Tax=Carnobacterium sp. TaxID=48221 RepID=UPI002FC6B8C3
MKKNNELQKLIWSSLFIFLYLFNYPTNTVNATNSENKKEEIVLAQEPVHPLNPNEIVEPTFPTNNAGTTGAEQKKIVVHKDRNKTESIKKTESEESESEDKKIKKNKKAKIPSIVSPDSSPLLSGENQEDSYLGMMYANLSGTLIFGTVKKNYK